MGAVNRGEEIKKQEGGMHFLRELTTGN
jgi:hypothetical protein